MASGPTSTGFRSRTDDDRIPSSFQRRVHWIFLGPSGIRTGWRILNSVWLWIVIATALTLALVAFPAVRSWVPTQNLRVVTPTLLFFSEGIGAIAAILSALVLARFEKRSLADYGLPFVRASGKYLGQGLLVGFAMVSALMGLIAAMSGFSPGALAIGGSEAWRSGLLYALGFMMLAVFEEFSFRGYFQATLASAIGFWPAAALLSFGFGGIHIGNPGETIAGVSAAVAFGLLAAFSLRRTGGIWLAIGMHAAWDWGQTYFYSVPDSGMQATGHLLNSSFHGPNWLTGGSAGPEGSVFVFAVLALTAAAIHYVYPAKR
ncbi:MAG TPA: type II CAAX endopeptidase family protein [Candidatus Acidoferrales bacterium]|nr:type II CAAX endopeptidase family protein [Candidatus Acidoferrales bacterium]